MMRRIRTPWHSVWTLSSILTSARSDSGGRTCLRVTASLACIRRILALRGGDDVSRLPNLHAFRPRLRARLPHLHRLMLLEILNLAFMLLRGLARRERSQVARPAGRRIPLARVQPVLSVLEFANHRATLLHPGVAPTRMLRAGCDGTSALYRTVATRSRPSSMPADRRTCVPPQPKIPINQITIRSMATMQFSKR